MAETFQTYRRRIRSVKSIAKITRAMELIAASRIVKARQRVQASTPYARELTAAVSAAASNATVDHQLLTEAQEPVRVGRAPLPGRDDDRAVELLHDERAGGQIGRAHV